MWNCMELCFLCTYLLDLAVLSHLSDASSSLELITWNCAYLELLAALKVCFKRHKLLIAASMLEALLKEVDCEIVAVYDDVHI